MAMPPIDHDKDIVARLADLHLQPDDIDILICTHFDVDHAGNHAHFPRAELIVQRSHYELARSGHQRFAMVRSQWDHPQLRYRCIDGDTELLSGIELIQTDGHATGHQSVLVQLPQTGPVLLAIDAVSMQHAFNSEPIPSHFDDDPDLARKSILKLLEIAKRQQATLVVFGHDGQHWQTLKRAPDFYV
jgi:N-acyl homoserine lactone hydrolase